MKIMLEDKLTKLEEIIRGCRHMLVALSGGVDSAFLLAFAYDVFSRAEAEGGEAAADCVAAVSATGPQFKKEEIAFAEELCDRMGVAHKKVDVSHVVSMIKRNPVDRCYHCKREIFGILRERAEITGSVLCDGTNADDMADYRPGYRAVCELGVKSPLLEAGLTKGEIREAMKKMEQVADRWNYPAFACLVSRIPYGETINEQKLEAIAAAEEFLRERGFTQLRVRCHEIAGKVSGNDTRFMARIELLEEEKEKFFSIMETVDSEFRQMGFEYVTLDLGVYEKGRMNSIAEALDVPDRIKVSEVAVRGNAANVESADIMAEIDRFLRETADRDYSFSDFVDIIERLRRPDGCPWDREQTHESLKKHMVEEANEALDAIDEGDWQHLCEELGDVLLQIVLHAQIAKEADEFDINDIVQCVSEKMIRRHPHVFGDIDVSGVDEGLDLWEEIKKREKMLKQ